MSYGLYQILIIVLTIGILFISKLPFLIELLIVIPLLIIIFTFMVTIYNNKAYLKLLPISSENQNNRLKKLDIDIANFEKLSLRKEDVFYLRTIPDCLVYVLKHTNISIWGCIYDYGKKRVFEFITRFENISLSTCSDKSAGNIPKMDGDLLQVFDGFDVEALFDEHIQSISYLQKKGFRPLHFSSGDFRRQYKEEMKKNIQYLQSFSFWILRLLYWVIIKYGKKYAYSIEEQAEASVYTSKADKLYQENLKKILAAAQTIPSYNIVFNGSIREGFTIDRVQNNLAKIFRTDRNKIEKLFRGRKIIIKKNINQELAKKYNIAFHKAGAKCIIEKNNIRPKK